MGPTFDDLHHEISSPTDQLEIR